ncbi:High affinity choline transporter 1 [Lonchura striata]|uniref:High affinity choline transporter 1 n=1 Tax=Lonchura striata TaxID=40157 RepID=A0A218V607_9PASE|nr:High affinity choline transporter 1 [Lonchura striata domestica]
MALNIPGLVSLSVFFTLTLATGIWASWKSRKDQQNRNPTEMAMVGGRNIHVFIGLFTATATWVGGAYINSTAELIYLPSKGLLWVQAPVGFALSLAVGGFFFVNPMRSKNYMTVMDPLQEIYGNMMGTLLFIPPLLGEVFWFAAILASLGATMRVILDIGGSLAITISACTVILYTLLGGLYSVAYTDVIQMVFITLSLASPWICIPFALVNSATESIYYTATHQSYQDPWIGKIEKQYLGRWLDDFFYLASETEVLWAMRTSMLVFGAGAAGLAYYSSSVYNLWFLSGELVYALLFPQLCCALFAPSTNTYGSAAGFLVGLLLRLLAGEPALSIPPVIHYPACSLVNGTYSQLFPFKTFTVLLTLGTILAVSHLAKALFQHSLLPRSWDVCNITEGTAIPIPLQQVEKQEHLPTTALEENQD